MPSRYEKGDSTPRQVGVKLSRPHQARAARPPVSRRLLYPDESRTSALSAKQKGGPERQWRARLNWGVIDAADFWAFCGFHLWGRLCSALL